MSSKYKPIKIDGKQIKKNKYFVSEFIFIFNSFFFSLKNNKLIKLVRIEMGNKIEKISIILNPKISKNGVPITKIPTPTIV